MLVDYHVHTLGHGEYGNTVEELYPFFSEASRQGLKQIGVADHTELAPKRKVSELQKANSYFPGVELRLGFELDFSKDTEEQLNIAMAMPGIDYFIGSIHYIGNWLVNNPKLKGEYARRDMDTVYDQYYSQLRAACLTGLFDIVGHFDLIKLFNPGLPGKGIMHYADPVLKVIRDSGLCVEINTSGLYRPAANVPSKKYCASAMSMGFQSLSVLMHTLRPRWAGIFLALQFAREVGYRQMATFAKRKRIMVNL